MKQLKQGALQVIDSHTAGEPTRVVIAGLPSIGDGDMKSRCEHLRIHADWVRTTLMLEPRAAPWMVGAVLQKPCDPECVAGVIFFNNTGYLGMCGHGLVGMVTTLAYLDRISSGRCRLETPVGVVSAELHDDGSVSLENVPSYCVSRDVVVDVPGFGTVVGDIAYGGNWFFLCKVPSLETSQIGKLTELAIRIKAALRHSKVCGDEGQEIDHIELVGPPSDPTRADAKNFVLCPGNQFDRSPCGTGTSAKLACLAERNELLPEAVWVQESVTGSLFQASYRPVGRGILPTIKSRAFITGETTIMLDADDPFRHGFDLSSFHPAL